MANKIVKFSELRVYRGRHKVTHSMKEIKQDFVLRQREPSSALEHRQEAAQGLTHLRAPFGS